MRKLETERLILRPFTMDDLEELHRLVYADPEVATRWAGRTKTLDEISDSFARKVRQREGEPGFLAIVLKKGGALLGLSGFQRYMPGEDTSYIVLEDAPSRIGQDPDFIEVELTYALGREHWKKGYATEAAKALIEYGFKELRIGRMVNSVSGENVDSVNLMRRLGFRIERNLHPRPSRVSDSPGVIGILDNDLT